MKISINEIHNELYYDAVQIFTEAFSDDPLFVFAFPEAEKRIKMTKVMYEFVVYEMVPKLKLIIKGAFTNEALAGCMIYTTPKSRPWSESMNDSIISIKEKASDERINLIGQYAVLSGYTPDVEYYHGNELAVMKKYRGRGIGKELLDDLISSCENDPEAKGILIDTANEQNITLYEKLDWELKATIPFYNIKKRFLWRENSKRV